MIPFKFDYYRPDTIQEAINAYGELDSKSKNPFYYSGGSEIISMARVHNIQTQAIIDLKAIPECNVLEFSNDVLIIGSSVTLSRISESKLFSLLEKACGRIADHTNQCRITIGGNVCGTIIYKETLLPLLLSDAYVIVASDGKLKQLPVKDVFDKNLKLQKGEFIVQFIIKKEFMDLPYVHVKKTKNEKIDYPLLSIAALKKDNEIRLAMSGVCSFPFRSEKIEKNLNEKNTSMEERAGNILKVLPAPILSDISASGDYRKFVLKNTLINVMETMEEV